MSNHVPTPVLPSYKIITNTPHAQGFYAFIKLNKALVVRDNTTNKYLEADHILIGSASLDKQDEHGEFHYEETTVSVADEEGNDQRLFVYKGTRALSLEETMFMLGVV